MSGLFTRIVLVILAALVGVGAAHGDELWSAREKRILASLSLPAAGPPPPQASNRVADSEAARRLGAKLFFDDRLSGNGELSCASCHQPGIYFTDGLPKSRGMGQTQRNAPTIVGAAYNAWFYWDGRRDSLWSQALIPIEAPDEMGGSRVAAVRLVGSDPAYRTDYEQLFGRFPDELLAEDLPEHAGPFGNKPVREAWFRLTQDQQDVINTVYSNLGKAIAAYERTLLPQETRFDRYVNTLLERNQQAAAKYLTEDEVQGARLFIDSDKTPCLQCHNGPMLTNMGFHNIGTGNFDGEYLDFGRVFGLRAVLMDEFNCLGPYSDAKPDQCLELKFLNKDSHIPLEGAYKVPSLRNLAATSPYFHDGRFGTLDDVLQHYRTANIELAPGTHEIPEFQLSDLEADQLSAFLLTLSDHNTD